MLKILAHCMLAVMCVSASACAAGEVVVSIKIKRVDGSPIDNVAAAIISDEQLVGGKTNANGDLQRTITTAANETSVHVLPLNYRWDVTPPSGRERLDAVETFQSNYAIESLYVIPLVSGQSNYSLEIIAYPAINVKCKSVDPAAVPLMSTAISSTFVGSESDASGVVETKGNKLGGPVRIFALFDNSRVVERTGGPFLQSDDLGSATIDNATNSQVHITFDATAPNAGRKREWLAQGITIVSANGQYVKSVEFAEWNVLDSGCDTPSAVSNTICVPQGQYWILPGRFMAKRPQIDMLDRIQASQSLGQAAVSVTAVAGQVAEVAVNLNQLIQGWKALNID